jgi:superfamily II DNA/RNA helicase
VRALQRPIDLLVGTPQRVLQHAAKGNLAFGDVRWIVLDEADTMFDTGGKHSVVVRSSCST